MGPPALSRSAREIGRYRPQNDFFVTPAADWTLAMLLSNVRVDRRFVTTIETHAGFVDWACSRPAKAIPQELRRSSISAPAQRVRAAGMTARHAVRLRVADHLRFSARPHRWSAPQAKAHGTTI